jgi:hypothetical protein
MALNDFLYATPTGQGGRTMNVAAGATAILSGEPVANALAGVTVTQAITNSPAVATDFWAGIAETASTQTASAAGTVQVIPLDPGQKFLVIPNVAATWNTQAKYDALVGKRVLVDLTTGVFTLLASDGSTNGLVVLPMLITENPGKVLIAVRAAVWYLA